MSDKILVIVHVEPEFEHGYGRLKELAFQISQYSEEFDHIINLTNDSEIFPDLKDLYNTTQYQWIYGLDPDAIPSGWIDGIDYIETTGHPLSEISIWMRELPKNIHYTLVGGQLGSCLTDIMDIWEHLKLTFDVNLKYVY